MMATNIEQEHFENLPKSEPLKLQSKLVQTIRNEQFDTTVYKYKVNFFFKLNCKASP